MPFPSWEGVGPLIISSTKQGGIRGFFHKAQRNYNRVSFFAVKKANKKKQTRFPCIFNKPSLSVEPFSKFLNFPLMFCFYSGFCCCCNFSSVFGRKNTRRTGEVDNTIEGFPELHFAFCLRQSLVNRYKFFKLTSTLG